MRADAGYAAPISDMNEALKDKKGIDESDYTAVGTLNGLSVDAKQKDTDRKPKTLFLQGVDDGYTRNVGYGFKATVAEYDTSDEVWTTLRTEKNTAVISSDLAPSRSNFDVGEGAPQIKLSGFYGEDKTLPKIST